MILYVKAFHIIFVVSWFAGLFYLPRIFVNIALVEKEHSEKNPNFSRSEMINLSERLRLILMAKKLFRFTTPIMGLAVGLGLILWLWYGIGLNDGSIWVYVKALLVVFLILYHLYCGKIVNALSNGPSHWSHIKFRWFNELPVLLLFLSVLLVVIKPF